MVRYLCKKIIQMGATLFALSIIVFIIARLTPGDPLRAYYGEAIERMSPVQLDMARERLGLNDNLLVQYKEWLINAASGDFGISFKYKQEVAEIVGQVWGNTAVLTLVSFVLISVLSVLLAVFCVRKEGSLADRVICKVGIMTNSIPEFLMALILIMIFAVGLGILPSSGAYSIGGGGFSDRLLHLILPVFTIVITHLWYCSYLIRNKLSDEIRKEYVLLCKVKGLSERRIMYKYCLKNILPAIVSIMTVFLPHLLGGSYIIEMVFSYPGLGTLGFESARYGDYNMLMIICLITGIIVVLANMLAQIINEKFDPRTKYDEVYTGEEARGKAGSYCVELTYSEGGVLHD